MNLPWVTQVREYVLTCIIMFEYAMSSKSEYAQIAELINKSDNVYYSVYNEEEMKYIWLFCETEDSILEMSDVREFREIYNDLVLS